MDTQETPNLETSQEDKVSKAEKAKEERKKNTEDAMKDPESTSGKRLKSFVERIERLEEEKKGLGEDIRDVYSESKGVGFEPKIIRKIVRMRKMSAEKRREEEELLDLYMTAISNASDTEEAPE